MVAVPCLSLPTGIPMIESLAYTHTHALIWPQLSASTVGLYPLSVFHAFLHRPRSHVAMMMMMMMIVSAMPGRALTIVLVRYFLTPFRLRRLRPPKTQCWVRHLYCFCQHRCPHHCQSHMGAILSPLESRTRWRDHIGDMPSQVTKRMASLWLAWGQTAFNISKHHFRQGGKIFMFIFIHFTFVREICFGLESPFYKNGTIFKLVVYLD